MATCLLVTNVFKPMIGGSAVVYENLAKQASNAIHILTASHDYRDGTPIPHYQNYDTSVPFSIYRKKLLRPQPVYNGHGYPAAIVRFLAHDIIIHVRTFFTVICLMRKHQIKTLCIGDLVALGWLGPIVKRLMGYKIILYIHGEEVSTHGWQSKFKDKRKRNLDSADRIIAVSNFTKDILTEKYQIPHSKITVITNGVDPSIFNTEPLSADTTNISSYLKNPYLLSLGRLIERKGFDHTIRAFSMIAADHPSLQYIIGGKGPYRAELSALALKYDLEDRVIFLDEISDKETVSLYQHALALVMPNRTLKNGDTEGFGLVFIEAGACGCPVIGGRAGGVPDAVKHKENGLLVNGENIDEIADAVTALIENKTLRDTLGSGGLMKANRNGWPEKTEKLLELL